MDNLGEYNLLIKKFVVGCKECDKNFTKTETTEIRALHKWIDFKDTDWGMSKYSSDRTQYIAYLEIIELNEFKGIVNDIYKNYVTKYPYSTKKDFIDQVFRHTIYDLEQFLERDLLWLWATPEEDIYTYYTCFLSSEKQFVDFAINNKYEIEHYRQYYRAVLEFLKSFEGQDNLVLKQNADSNYSNSLYDEIFKVNKENADSLKYKYDLNQFDHNYILNSFRPIIQINHITPAALKTEIEQRQNDFLKTNGFFDEQIFQRETTDLLLFSLNNYLNCITRGKATIWDKYKNDYFHKLKFDGDANETLIISEKDQNQLEYFMKEMKSIVTQYQKRTDKLLSQQTSELSDLITHENNSKIVQGIKIQYKNIKGKQLKLLLLALQQLDLLPENRIAKKFYDRCKTEFDWDIASYNAMNGYDFNSTTDTPDLDNKKKYIKTLMI